MNIIILTLVFLGTALGEMLECNYIYSDLFLTRSDTTTTNSFDATDDLKGTQASYGNPAAEQWGIPFSEIQYDQVFLTNGDRSVWMLF